MQDPEFQYPDLGSGLELLTRFAPPEETAPWPPGRSFLYTRETGLNYVPALSKMVFDIDIAGKTSIFVATQWRPFLQRGVSPLPSCNHLLTW